MRIELLRVSDERWGWHLARIGQYDFYHMPEYLALESGYHGGDAYALVVMDEFNGAGTLFMPLMLRRVDFCDDGGERFDLSSPYGYGAPLLRFDGTSVQRDQFLRKSFDFVKGYLAESGVVSLFLRMHPLIPIGLPGLDSETERLVEHGETVYIDLTQPEEVQRSQMNKTTRRCIRRADRHGLNFVLDDQWDYLDDFAKVYAINMERLSARPSLRFTRDYFAQVRDQLGDVMRLGMVLDRTKPICGVLFSEINGIVQDHLGGAIRLPELERLGPNRFLTDRVRRWVMERGNRVYHLGGGLGGGPDSLFRFKSGFSALRKKFLTVRIVVDPVAYRQLSDRWEELAGENADDLDGYFPAYARPIPNLDKVWQRDDSQQQRPVERIGIGPRIVG